MPAPDQKPDQGGAVRPDLASKTDPGRSASPDQSTGDGRQATDAPPETKDDGSTTPKGKGGAKGKDDAEKKTETVECPSCAGAAEGKPAELVPYPDDGPNEFKRGTAFCEREGKRVRIDKDPDEDAQDAAAPTV